MSEIKEKFSADRLVLVESTLDGFKQILQKGGFPDTIVAIIGTVLADVSFGDIVPQVGVIAEFHGAFLDWDSGGLTGDRVLKMKVH